MSIYVATESNGSSKSRHGGRELDGTAGVGGLSRQDLNP